MCCKSKGKQQQNFFMLQKKSVFNVVLVQAVKSNFFHGQFDNTRKICVSVVFSLITNTEIK